MAELPRRIVNDLMSNKTSLGEHPAFPPEDEEKFIVSLLQSHFDEICNGVDISNPEELKTELGKLIAKCRQIESENKQALEQLCMNVVTAIFNIPQDTLDIKVEITDNIDTSSERIIPEKTTDFSFDSIDDMKTLGDEIYKRRLLDAIIAGAAIYYARDVYSYIQELFKIDSELPALYKKIFKYNDILLFLEKKYIPDENTMNAGKVDVMVRGKNTMVKIDAKGIIFPVLLEETVKGILELAVSHGLPSDIEKAQYVIKKSDFKLAEIWDVRLGYALWNTIAEQIDDNSVEPNFLLMELSTLPVEQFNQSMQEIFAKTKKGKEILSDICSSINREKDEDDFNDFIKTNNDRYPVDDGYFTSEELIADSI